MFGILLYLVIISTLTNLAEITPDFHKQPRIIGGKDCKLKDTKFMIALTDSGGNHVCGGSLVNSYWVLSAAHCKTEISLYASNVLTRAKWVNGRGVLSFWAPVTKIETINIHPKYDQQTTENDIALMQLKSPIRESDSVLFVKLPTSILDKEPPEFCPTAAIMGWGTIDKEKTVIPMKLQCAKLKTISFTDCSIYYSIIPDNVMCTAANKEKDACFGDSGGPLMCGDVQYGIASWGVECAERWPGVYTRVDRYLGFINKFKSKSVIRSKNTRVGLFYSKSVLIAVVLFNINF